MLSTQCLCKFGIVVIVHNFLATQRKLHEACFKTVVQLVERYGKLHPHSLGKGKEMKVPRRNNDQTLDEKY